MLNTTAQFQIGQIVCHKKYGFRGIIFDVDPEFGNTEEWYESIPQESRPRKDQPFYHLLAERVFRWCSGRLLCQPNQIELSIVPPRAADLSTKICK
jgi:hypothetical protein